MGELVGYDLVAGTASGVALVVEPLSLWGACDPETGVIIDRHHPSAGATIAGRCLVMAHGIGSSSSASILAEALHNGTGPAAIILEEPDAILALGSAVADELYEEGCPVVVLPEATKLIPDDAEVAIARGGRITTA